MKILFLFYSGQCLSLCIYTPAVPCQECRRFYLPSAALRRQGESVEKDLYAILLTTWIPFTYQISCERACKLSYRESKGDFWDDSGDEREEKRNGRSSSCPQRLYEIGSAFELDKCHCCYYYNTYHVVSFFLQSDSCSIFIHSASHRLGQNECLLKSKSQSNYQNKFT